MKLSTQTVNKAERNILSHILFTFVFLHYFESYRSPCVISLLLIFLFIIKYYIVVYVKSNQITIIKISVKVVLYKNYKMVSFETLTKQLYL